MKELRVLITNCILTGRSGTEVYVRDLALALAARGHVPLVFTPKPGGIADELVERGVEVRDRLADFSSPPDIVHGHHTIPTLKALLHFGGVPGLFVCHDATSHIDTTPVFPRILRHVAVDYNCRQRVRQAGVPANRVHVICNSVDLTRFRPRGVLPPRPTRALLFSNYANDQTHLRAVSEACARAGLPLDVVGAGVGKPSREPEAILGDYDLVFAKARCALEAMAVGTAVILCDFRGVGEMVTAANVDEFRRWNFGARLLRHPLDPHRLEGEIARYDPDDAREVSGHIRRSAGLDGQVDELIALYREVLAEWARAPKSDRRIEGRAAVTAIRAMRPPRRVRKRLRKRLRRMPIVGPALVKIKRVVLGPRPRPLIGAAS